jgi:hypothetical protein
MERPVRNTEAQTKNAELQEQPLFRRACEVAGIPVTKRQASKWNNGYGKALQFRRAAQEAIKLDAEWDEALRENALRDREAALAAALSDEAAA